MSLLFVKYNVHVMKNTVSLISRFYVNAEYCSLLDLKTVNFKIAIYLDLIQHTRSWRLDRIHHCVAKSSSPTNNS